MKEYKIDAGTLLAVDCGLIISEELHNGYLKEPLDLHQHAFKPLLASAKLWKSYPSKEDGLAIICNRLLKLYVLAML